MSDIPNPQPAAEDDEALKRRLLSRIGVAAVMVVGLLGSLAMFDALNQPARAPATKVAALPPKAAPEPAAEPSAPAADPAKEEAKPAEPGTEAKADAKPDEAATPAGSRPDDNLAGRTIPERTASVPASAPPLQPLPAEKPLTKPATTRPAIARPSEPVPPPSSPAAKPEPAREIAKAQPTAPPSRPVTQRAPASRPLTQAAERQFALQMGVFNNIANAEDLRAKLELNGIPASIEARVHVGPFATREEADIARARLKELGLDGGLLVTMKK